MKNNTLPQLSKFTTDSLEYNFSNQAELEATYFVIAWFAVTESASLGIFPIMAALETTAEKDATYFNRFFEHGFQHFTDEQAHANMWCRALQDFVEKYPEVVKQVSLPRWYMNIMLKSIGKPHDVAGFVIDCLAFEVVMQALYEVMSPRLNYPPVRQIVETILRDESAHTDFGRHHITTLVKPRGWQRFKLSFRFWRNMLGVYVTIRPLLKMLDKYRPLAKGEFVDPLSKYAEDTSLHGQFLLPALIKIMK